jgi:hypothetical protein
LAVARAIAAALVLHEYFGDLRIADRPASLVFIDEFASMSRLCRVRAGRNERGRQLRRPVCPQKSPGFTAGAEVRWVNREYWIGTNQPDHAP